MPPAWSSCPPVQEEIQKLLSRIEATHGVRIPYACESGSRAWGFASPDSDYDIRFLFVRPEEDYISVWEQADTIELPLENELDAGGWIIPLISRSSSTVVSCRASAARSS